MKITEKQHFESYAMPLRSNENVANKILFGKEVSWNNIIHIFIVNYYCGHHCILCLFFKIVIRISVTFR